MTDVFSPSERSAIMRNIKHRGNKSTEVKLISIFKHNSIVGWRRNYPVIGKPDFVFLKCKIAVFADGCFWHGHHCRNITPKQNDDYWKRKLQRNRERDKKVNELFVSRGWRVLRFWECDIQNGNIDLTQLK